MKSQLGILLQGETTMMLTKIPHFREVVVCSFECPHCGNRCTCWLDAISWTSVYVLTRLDCHPPFLSQGNSCVCEGPPKDNFIVNIEGN